MSARTPVRTLVPLALALGAAAGVLTEASSPLAQTRPRRNTAAHRNNGDAGAGDASSGVQSETAAPGSFQGPQTTGGNANVGSGSTAQNGAQPSSSELRGDQGATTVQETGPIGPADVARLVHAQMPRLRACYEYARGTHPNLAGRVQLHFTLDGTGHVTQATAVGMPEAPEVSDCVRNALLQTTFPRPVSSPMSFDYPVTFVPEPPPPRNHGRGSRARPAARH